MAIDAAGISVKEAAERLETTEQSVYRWIRGEVEPSLKTLREVSRVTDRPLYFFISSAAPAAPKKMGLLTVEVDGVILLRAPIHIGSDVHIGLERAEED